MAWPRSPSLPLISRASKPGASVGTRNAVTPRGPGPAGAGEDQRDLGPGAVGDEHLLAGQQPVVAVPVGPGGEVAGVRAGAGLGQPEAGQRLAGGQPGQPLLRWSSVPYAAMDLPTRPRLTLTRCPGSPSRRGRAPPSPGSTTGSRPGCRRRSSGRVSPRKPSSPSRAHDVPVHQLVPVPAGPVRDHLAVDEVGGRGPEQLLLLGERERHAPLLRPAARHRHQLRCREAVDAGDPGQPATGPDGLSRASSLAGGGSAAGAEASRLDPCRDAELASPSGAGWSRCDQPPCRGVTAPGSARPVGAPTGGPTRAP